MNTHLKIGFISDIHLYHHKTPTSQIVEEIKHYFNKDTLSDLNILFIGGDFFDRLVTMSKDITIEAFDCIYYLLRYCKETDTQLRILEGTPSHDWQQSKWFIRINELSNIGCDVKYFTDVEVEYNERYDINVLYIPDEWDADTTKTLDYAKSLLKKKNLSQVDLAIMHGAFTYQLPQIARAPKHNEEEYLKLVKYYISIGHIHKHSVYERILAQGSFSRLIHGEEEPKGFIIAEIDPDGSMSYSFIENTEALQYIDIDISYTSVEESFRRIRARLSGVKDMSYIRLLVEKDHPILKDLDTVWKTFSQYRWSPVKIIDDKIKKTQEISPLLFQDYQAIQLTTSNLSQQLLERLVNKGYTQKEVEMAEVLLQEVMSSE